MSIPFVVRGAPGVQYEDDTNRKHVLGQLMELSDGRKFRYVLVGATALVVGDLIQGKVFPTGDYTDVVVDVVAAIGDTTVSITPTTTTAANYHAGGFMHVNKHAAVGGARAYRIKEHVVFAASAGKVVTLEQWDPIQVALAVNDEVGLTPNPYNGVIQAPITTLTSRLVGVAVHTTTAAQYGWVQTGGVCSVQADGSLVVGNKTSAILAAAGRCGVVSGDVDEDIGIVLSVASTAGEFASIYLNMD